MSLSDKPQVVTDHHLGVRLDELRGVREAIPPVRVER